MSSEEPPPRPSEAPTTPHDLRPRLRYVDTDEDPLSIVRDSEFPIVFRGYAREQVDAFVARISELIAELDASRSPESAVKAALDRVGEETSGILQRARETAEEITARSRAQADDRVQVAEREASAIRSEADARVQELDDDIEALWRERARLLEEIRRIAEELTAVATAAEERTPPSPEGAGASGGAVSAGPAEGTTTEILAAEAESGPADLGEPGEPDGEPAEPPDEEPIGAEQEIRSDAGPARADEEAIGPGEEPIGPDEEPSAQEDRPTDPADDPTLDFEDPDRRT
jgi:DivIVA domain-containing protein